MIAQYDSLEDVPRLKFGNKISQIHQAGLESGVSLFVEAYQPVQAIQKSRGESATAQQIF